MATALLPKPKKNPLLGDPNENPFRRPPELAETPTDRQPPSGYGYGAPGQDNARALLASRNIAVGGSAQAANPGAQKMSWRDIAAEAGIEDFKGPKRDPRFRALQDAFYGHADFGGVEDPERAGYKRAMAKGIIGGARWQGSGGGPGGAGGPGGGPGGDLGSQADRLISDLLGGKGPYTEDVVNNMRANAFEDFAGGLSAQNRAAMNRASRSGNLYSASTGAEAAENERVGRAGLARSHRDIESRAAEGNYGAKIQGLQAYQSKLAGEREERIANARNDVEREAIRSQYDQAIKTTQMQIDAQRELQQSAQGAAGGAAARARQWELEDREQQRQWYLEDRDYEEPWRYYSAASGSQYEMPVY